MSNQKSLFSLTLLYTIGSLSFKVMSFVLVFFTTFYLSKENVGEFDLIIITLSLLSPLVTFQLIDAALRWLLVDHSFDNITKVFSTITAILLISLLLFSIIIFGYNYFFPFKHYVLLYVALFFQTFNLFFLQCIRGIGKNKMYVVNGLINTFLYVSLSITSLTSFDFKVEGLLYSMIISTIITSLLLFFQGKLYVYLNLKKVDFNLGRSLCAYSLPLIPNSLSWWAISSANRYIILLYLGAAANGVFAIANKLPTILLMFLNIFYLAWQEKAITNYEREDRDEYYTQVFEKYIRILFSISILIVTINKFVLRYTVSTSFFEAWEYTPLLLLSIIFSSMAGFYGIGYLSSKKTVGALSSSIFGGLTTVALSFLLIPKLALHGASIAIVIGYLVLLIIRIIHSKAIFTIIFPSKIFYQLFILFIVCSLLNYGSFAITIINIFVGIIGLLFFNKTELINNIPKVRLFLNNKF